MAGHLQKDIDHKEAEYQRAILESLTEKKALADGRQSQDSQAIRMAEMKVENLRAELNALKDEVEHSKVPKETAAGDDKTTDDLGSQLKATYLVDEECVQETNQIDILNTPGLRIIKFCHEEHNLAKGKNRKIQLATTDYYKDGDPLDERTDETEGTGVLKQNWIDEVSQIRFTENTYISPLPPHYVFCASLDAKPKFNQTYKDKYFINDVPKFCSLIEHLLQERLEALVAPEQLILLVMGYSMAYGKIVPYRHPNVVKDIKMLRDETFRKPLSYTPEQEARLAYFPRTVRDGFEWFFPFGLLEPTILLDISRIHSEFMKIVGLE